jgi:uncharacterized protein YoxC
MFSIFGTAGRRCKIMEWILYVSALIFAISFLVLVIFIGKTLKTFNKTLQDVSTTLNGLEKQLEGISKETEELLHKTNQLADDLQQKSSSLNHVVTAVKGVGETIHEFNRSLKKTTNSVVEKVEKNEGKMTQLLQWSQIAFEIKEKWDEMKKRKRNKENENEHVRMFD